MIARRHPRIRIRSHRRQAAPSLIVASVAGNLEGLTAFSVENTLGSSGFTPPTLVDQAGGEAELFVDENSPHLDSLATARFRGMGKWPPSPNWISTPRGFNTSRPDLTAFIAGGR